MAVSIVFSLPPPPPVLQDSIEALSARESLSLALVWTNKKTVVLMAGDLEFNFLF